MTNEEIYKLLKENASKSCSEELRKQYIDLCVDILRNIKKEQPAKPQEESDEVKSSKEENANNYINALCTLISLVNKDTLGKEELDELKESCWLNKNKK